MIKNADIPIKKGTNRKKMKLITQKFNFPYLHQNY